MPVITLQTNTLGTTHLLEAIKESDYDPVIVSISTSEVYGMPEEDEVPIKELILSELRIHTRYQRSVMI